LDVFRGKDATWRSRAREKRGALDQQRGFRQGLVGAGNGSNARHNERLKKKVVRNELGAAAFWPSSLAAQTRQVPTSSRKANRDEDVQTTAFAQSRGELVDAWGGGAPTSKFWHVVRSCCEDVCA
jgi:hypothetical protein